LLIDEGVDAHRFHAFNIAGPRPEGQARQNLRDLPIVADPVRFLFLAVFVVARLLSNSKRIAPI